MVTVYVLEGATTGKRYVGITNDLQRRLVEHRNHRTKGSQIIGVFTLLHVEEFPDYATARAQEKFLKSGQGRAWLRRKYPQRSPPKAGKAAPKRACPPLADSNPSLSASFCATRTAVDPTPGSRRTVLSQTTGALNEWSRDYPMKNLKTQGVHRCGCR